MIAIGDLIGGKYRIVRLIGDGGMGSVYEARHEKLGTPVALKFLHPELSERAGLAERFLQEGRVAATIQSTHVARVTDVDTTPDGVPYLVMDYLTGESLQHLLDRERKLPQAQAIDFALQILSGLEAAHRINVVHRDLKPDNVFVTPGEGDRPVLKLIDFGIAKLREAGRSLTRAGVVMGTPEYMPPEQLYTASEVDERADIYALGVILFEMLSGKRPADGEDAQDIVSKVLTGETLLLDTLEPTLPPQLVAIVRRATAPDREQRFRSVADMRLALVSVGAAVPELAPRPISDAPAADKRVTEDEPPIHDISSRGSTELGAPPIMGEPPAWPTSLNPPPPRKRRKRPAVWAAVLLLLLATGAAAGAMIWFQQQTVVIPPLASPGLPLPQATDTTAGLPPATPDFRPTPVTPTATPPNPSPDPRSRPEPGTSPTASTPSVPTFPDAGAFSDGGLLPFPLPLPSTFPALPPLPSVLPTAIPSTFPTTFPTAFPPFPGFGPAAPAPSADAGRG